MGPTGFTGNMVQPGKQVHPGETGSTGQTGSTGRPASQVQQAQLDLRATPVQQDQQVYRSTGTPLAKQGALHPLTGPTGPTGFTGNTGSTGINPALTGILVRRDRKRSMATTVPSMVDGSKGLPGARFNLGNRS